MLTARPVFNDKAHRHPTSVLAAGGGMIDVQAADAPGLFAEPSGVSFGLVRPARAETRSLALSDAGGGAGTWTVTAPGLDAPATIDIPAGGSQTLALALRPPPRTSIGNRSGNVVLTSGTHTVHIRWWGYVERPRLAGVRSRRLRAGHWVRGDTREGTKVAQHYRWPAAPGGSGLPRVYPGREQLWSFTVPAGARNAGVVADGAVVPQILLARDENRLAGEPALPSNGNPYLETYGRFERVSGLLVPGPGTLLRRRRDARGPHARPLPPPPLDRRPHAARHRRDHAARRRRRHRPLPRDRPRQRRQHPRRRRARGRHAGGRRGLGTG